MSTSNDSPFQASLRRFLAESRPAVELDNLSGRQLFALASSGDYWRWAAERDTDFVRQWCATPEDQVDAFMREIRDRLRREEGTAGGATTQQTDGVRGQDSAAS
jgi:hypothetical protein